ncbi:SDR family oxidoreductase [Nocardiopsis sp. MG754419]|uniref:SDR family oxidoreductase n=1 Tax=Nocardiopsis sp. MG754419 TaxID=2259865 RepID=UPI001BABD5B8|nr:SDR family oxidoreductase [Nocardiopsis sp. MG754419]MBR8740609.1 NAD(P)-dependent oxidoreductase [Nocardiopsis sp. MG754419]
MSVQRTMLVTGATGVVGWELVGRARAAGWDVVGCSARGGDGGIAWRMGQEPPPPELDRAWHVIVHAAARPRWNLPRDEAISGNLAPVAALEPLVGRATHVIHLSTAFSIGLRGDTRSASLDDYRNTYEWSKAAAEREARERYAASIVRPPLILGRRSDGVVRRRTGLYSLLQASVTGALPVLVGDPDVGVEAVTTCDVATCVLSIAERGPVGSPVVLGRAEHASSAKTIWDLAFSALNDWRRERGAGELDTPTFVTPDQWHRFYLPFARPHLSDRQLRTIDLLGEFIPYLSRGAPIGVNRYVEPIDAALPAIVRGWAERLPGLAMRSPRPWTIKEQV